jgi:hypothetical protein
MINLDEISDESTDLIPQPRFPGKPQWPGLGGPAAPMNVGQVYQAERRAAESNKLSKLFLDETEFSRLAGQSEMRESVRMSPLGEDLPKVALNAAYLSHQMGRRVSADEYELARDNFAVAQFGQEDVTDGQFFDLVKGQYDVRRQKTEALDELRLRMAGQTLEDAITGKNTPTGTVWKAWREENKELVGGDDDLPYLASAVADRERFRTIADKYKHLAGPGLDLLRKFTAGEAGEKDLSDFARTMTTIPREEQDTVIDLIALGADAGQIDRGALKEFGLALGQTFSRGFNFIPQAAMQNAQLAFTEIQEVLETGDVFLTGSGEPTLTNVQRPGNTRPMAGVAVFDLRGRKATAEDIALLKEEAAGAMDVLRIERQLRAVADNNVDPIKRIYKGGVMGALEGGVLGVAGSLPLLTATAVNPFAGMMAYQALEFDRMLNENPDMSVRAAQGISLIEGAWQAAIDRLQLSTLQGALPVTGRLLGKIKSTGLRRTVGFAASGAEQFGQELTQDIGTMAIDAIASSLREDMKDKDFTFELGEYWKQAPEVLVASLIFGMWGGGAITARELRGTPAEWDEAARIVGIDEAGRKRMQAATTPEELDAVVERELKAVTPQSQAAGALYAKAKRQAAESAQADPNEPTLEVVKDDQGNNLYRITTPDGQVLIESKDPQAAQAAFLDYRTAAETNEVQALREAVSFWQSREGGLSFQDAPGLLITDELSRLEGIGDVARIEQLRQRLVAADIDPDSDLTGVQIFGSVTVEDVGQGVYQGTSLLRQGATPETVFEEGNHYFVRRALLRGDVNLETLTGWLDQTAAATGLDIKRGNEIEVIESIAQVGMDLFNGRLDQAQIPQGLMDYFRRLMRVIKEVYARAIKVTEAFDKGEIDGNFEQFLMQSMGMDPQQQIDINSTDTAANLSTGAPENQRGPDGLTDTERFALEQELLADMEAEASEAAGDGGIDILDAVREAGGLPTKSSSKVYQYAGELQRIREAQKGGNATGVKGAFNLFRKNAPDLDAVIKDLQTMGFRDVTTPAELFDLVERRLTSGRKIYGYEGAAMADYSVGRAPRLKAAVAAIHEEALLQRDIFLSDVTTAARRAGGRAVKEKFKSAVKKLVTSINKVDRKPNVPSDLLRVSVEAPAGGPQAARRVATRFIESMRIEGYELYAPGGKPDITDRHAEGAEEYVDIALKFVRAGAGLDPVVKEVLVVQPAMLKAKSEIHTLFERWRDALKRYGSETDSDRVQMLVKVARKSEAGMRKLAMAAYALDSRTARIQPLSAVQSSDDISSGSLGMSISGMPSFASSALNPASATERAVSFVLSAFSIRGKDTAQAAGGQGRITTENIGEYAGEVDVSELAKYPDALRQTFNLAPKDSAVQVVPLSSLVSLKNELESPRFLAGTKKDPRQTAADAMVRNIENRGGKKRDPLDVADNGDGTFTIRDGNATAQAAMLAGWSLIPVKVEGAADFSVGRARVTFADQLQELQAGELDPVDTSKTFWLIASSSGDIVDILGNEQDAKSYFQTTASTGEWLWEYQDGLRTEVPLLKRGVAERRAEGYIDTVRAEQERGEKEWQGYVFYGADTSPETATSAGEIPGYTPDGRPWAGQEESVVYHGGRLFDPQGTDPGGYGETQTLKPRRPDQTYLFSVGRPRVDRALASAMNRKPGERLAMYERAKEMFDRVSARRGESTGPDGYARTLQSLWELDAILKVLPAEVRGKVGGFTQIAALEPTDLYQGDELLTESNSPAGARISAWMREGLNIGEAGKKTELPPGYSTRRATDPARATKATDDFLVKRIATVGKQLDRYLAAEYRIAIERALEAAKPKRSESGVRKSTLGPETQAYADKALAASNLDNDQTAARLAAIEAELLNPETKDEARIDLVEEWGLVNTLGDLDSRNAETLAQAYAELRDRLKAGRAGWRIQEEARIAGQRETVATLLAGFGEPTKAKRFAQKSQVQELVEKLSAVGIDHGNFEQVLRAVFGDHPVVEKWSTMMRKSDNGDQDMEMAMRDQLLDAIKTAAKAAGMRKGQAFRLLKTKSALKVRALDGKPLPPERISIELAQKIVRGTADRSNLTAADVAILREKLDELPPDTRKDFITFDRAFVGNPSVVELTPAQAIQLELSWDQPDVQEKMRREGWTDESIEDIRAITSQPVAAETLAFLRKFYAENYALVNPIYARMFGMNMPQAKFYAPSRYKSVEKKDDIGLDGSPQVTGSTPGFAKSRVGHSAPIDPVDALTVFQQHAVQTAHWIHFAEFSREVRGVLSNLPLQEAIEQKFGRPVLQSLQAWLDQIEQRGANKSREMQWMNAAMGAYLSGTSVSSLGFNLRTVAINSDSGLRFLWALTPQQIGSALMTPAKLAQAMPKVWFSPSVQRRIKGGSNPAAQFVFTRGAAKPGPFSTLGWFSFQPVQWYDAAATTFSSAMVFQATYNDAMAAGLGEVQAEAAALEAVDAVIYRYSQPTGFGSKSNVENTSGAFGKLLTLFMSDPRLKTGVMLEAVREIGRGKDVAMNVQKLLVVETLAIVSHVIASAYRDAFSDDEDEDIWSPEGFALAMILAPFQGLFLAGAVTETAFRMILGMKTWAPPTAPYAGNIESLGGAVRNWEQLFSPDTFADGVNAWNRLLRGLAINAPFAAPAALLNMIKPFVGLQENLEADE